MKRLSKNTATVSLQELGTRCWSAKRFLGQCFLCRRYYECKYPERIANKEYDELVRKFSVLKKKIEKMRGEIDNECMEREEKRREERILRR